MHPTPQTSHPAGHTMPDPNIVDVLERVGIPAATSLSVCWGAMKWVVPRLLREEILATTKPELKAMERRLGEQQRSILEELSRHTGQIARSLEKMSERMSEQGADLAELRGEVRAARGTWSPYDRRNEPR